MKNFRPLNGIIVIKKDERDITDGGIHLVKTEELHYGTIVAAGKGEYDKKGKFKAVSVKPGQRVVIAPNAGVELEVDGQKYTFMTENEITAIIKDKVES